LSWVDKEFKLFSSSTKELEEGTLKLTRERYSGRNNFDTSKKILKRPDQTLVLNYFKILTSNKPLKKQLSFTEPNAFEVALK